MKNLQTLFEISSRDHNHLCPRQILGVRLGLAGAAALGLEPPVKDKRLLVVTETDGCFVDGVTAALPLEPTEDQENQCKAPIKEG